MLSLNKSFEASYTTEEQRVFPPHGEVASYYYPGTVRSGHDGVIVKITPESELFSSWIGVFEFGQISRKGMTGLFTTPNTKKFCVVARGSGYLVNVDNPRDHDLVQANPVFKVVAAPETGLLIFADYLRLCAYNANGLAWRTKRLSWDGLEIGNIVNDRLFGTSWSAPFGRRVNFTVDLKTGDHEGGAGPFP